MNSGHIHVQSTGYIGSITAESGQKVTVDGSVDKVVGVAVQETSSGYVADNNGAGPKGDANKAGIAISNKTELYAFRNGVNNGSLKGVTARLTSNIDLSGESWLPIGTSANPFYGTIIGGDHTIKGLTGNYQSVGDENWFKTESTQIYGSSYGFIARTGNGNVTIKDLSFTDVDINLTNVGSAVGTVIGYATGAYSVVVDNVNVSGSQILGIDSLGGVVGKAYNTGSVSVTNCETSIFVQSSKKTGGIVGYISGPTAANICNNIVNKNVETTGTAQNSKATAGPMVDKIALFTTIGKNFVYFNNSGTGKAKYNDNEINNYEVTYYTDEEASVAYTGLGEIKTLKVKIYESNLLITTFYNTVTIFDSTFRNFQNDTIKIYGTVEINNSTFTGPLQAQADSQLTLNDCAGYALYAPNSGHILVNNGNFTLSGGEICLGGTVNYNITVFSGVFNERYIAKHLPASTAASSFDLTTQNPPQYVTEYEGYRYTATRGNGSTWVVTKTLIS